MAANNALQHIVERLDDRFEDVLAPAIGHEFHVCRGATRKDEHDDRHDRRDDDGICKDVTDPASGFRRGEALGIQGDLGQEMQHDGNLNENREDDEKPLSSSSGLRGGSKWVANPKQPVRGEELRDSDGMKEPDARQGKFYL